MPIYALSVLCAQLTRDLLAIAKFDLVYIRCQMPVSSQIYIWPFLSQLWLHFLLFVLYKILSCFSGLELIPLFTSTFYHLFNFIVDPRVMLCP